MNIVLTGASSGIGYETVKKLSQDSTNIIIAIARNQSNLAKLKKECLSLNTKSQVRPVVFDLENNDFSILIPEIEKHFSKINILINNAGLLIKKPFEELGQDELLRTFNVNLFSPFKLIQLLLPYFDTDSTSHIVNISSMAGFQGSTKFPGLAAYSSSKAALVCLTECLAEELRNKRIHINSLALGAIQTKMLQKAFPGYDAPITSSQIAQYLADFSLNGHKYFNGKTLPVSISVP